MRKIWGTFEKWPHSQATIIAAVAAGAAEIIELPFSGIAIGYQEIPDLVPQQVSAYQAKAALANAGLYDSINAYMITVASPLDRLAWNEAPMFQRGDELIANLSGALNLTPQLLDDLFVAAAKIMI